MMKNIKSGKAKVNIWKKYNKDLTTFTKFTGNKDKPENIKSFRDIELLDFKLLNYCKKDIVQKLLYPKMMKMYKNI